MVEGASGDRSIQTALCAVWYDAEGGRRRNYVTVMLGLSLFVTNLSPRGCWRAVGTQCEPVGSECEPARSDSVTECEPGKMFASPRADMCEPLFAGSSTVVAGTGALGRMDRRSLHPPCAQRRRYARLPARAPCEMASDRSLLRFSRSSLMGAEHKTCSPPNPERVNSSASVGRRTSDTAHRPGVRHRTQSLLLSCRDTRPPLALRGRRLPARPFSTIGIVVTVVAPGAIVLHPGQNRLFSRAHLRPAEPAFLGELLQHHHELLRMRWPLQERLEL